MLTIEATVRTVTGKGANRRLRIGNKFPAVIYGGLKNPVLITLNHDRIWNLQAKSEFYQDRLLIIIDGKKEKVKVQDIQRHPFKPKLTHIDFIRV